MDNANLRWNPQSQDARSSFQFIPTINAARSDARKILHISGEHSHQSFKNIIVILRKCHPGFTAIWWPHLPPILSSMWSTLLTFFYPSLFRLAICSAPIIAEQSLSVSHIVPQIEEDLRVH